MNARTKPITQSDLDRMHGVELIKLPPHSVECEQSVLGGLLLDNAAWERIADLVAEKDFYRGDHRLIWRHISALIEHSKPADVITVAEALQEKGELDSIGGLAYLGALASGTPTAANIRRYAEIVHDRALLRGLAEASTAIADLAYNPNGRLAADIADEAQQKMFAVTESTTTSAGFVEMQPILSTVVEHVDAMYNRADRDAPIGLSTGFADLDRQTSGLSAGDLVVLAARPSMGKTSLALNFATHAGVVLGHPIGIFSMEMPKEQLVLRMVCQLAGLNFHMVRKGILYDDEWKKFSDGVASLVDAPIHIDETGAITPTELRARARRLFRQHGRLGLIVVDYLQLMSVGGRVENRATEISEISRSLKALAKELAVPVVALSQLNRSVEQRPNKRPMMSDLRESGAIEQDADLILFLYRDEVYNSSSADKGLAEAIIGKQRNGPLATVMLGWQGTRMRFVNAAREHQVEPGSDG